MRTLRILTFTLLLTAAGLAADATGTWTGTFVMKSPNGEERNGTAHMILKQDGAALTGSAGPDASQQDPISNGKVDGDALSFELPIGDAIAKVAMKISGDALTGELSADRNGAKITAKIELKRSN